MMDEGNIETPPQIMTPLPPPGEAAEPSSSEPTGRRWREEFVEGPPVRPPLPEVPDRCGPPTIPLSVLLDFAIQHVYHEITVLAELMQRKTGDQTDQDKKISLVNFAHATRTQFVKLLALVKWIKQSKNIDMCNAINFILDLQAQYFVESADRLVAMTRGDLVLARLPEYQIIPAIDMLTLGTYSRMPTKIKEAFIPPAKITPREQTLILARLNQMIENRLSVLSTTLAPKYEYISIQNGMATFTVPGEFEIKMTILGNTLRTKWTLLDIKILVEDYELGLGRPLVHPVQLNQLHSVLQTRMNVSKHPINEAFHFLHTFCITLQLDVLFCQSSRLVTGKLRDNITIEKYDVKERILIVGYWVKRSRNRKVTLGAAKSEAQYRIQIYEDKDDKSSGLKVRHIPHAPHLGKLDCDTGRLSMDRLLSETYIVRCRERLLRLRRIIEKADPTLKIQLTGCNMPSLTLPLLPDSDLLEESLVIAVNSFCGRVICDVHKLDKNEDVVEFGRALYSNCSDIVIRMFLDKLRIALIIERYRDSIKSLPVLEKKENEMNPFLKDIKDTLPEHRIYLKFVRSEHYYLIVTFVPHPTEIVTIELLLMQFEDDAAQIIALDNIQHLWSKPVIEAMNNITIDLSKRSTKPQVPGREQRLAFAVAAVEDRLSYMFLAAEMEKRGIGIDLRPDNEHVPGGLSLYITDISQLFSFDVTEFFKCCVRSCLRMDNRSRVVFQFEMCFENIPLVRDVPHGVPNRKDGPLGPNASKNTTWIQELSGLQTNLITCSPEKLVDSVIHRLSRYLNMYKVVYNFSVAYHSHYYQFCSIEAFTFHKLVVSYGPNRDQLMILAFNPKTSTVNSEDHFLINFGQTMPHREFDSSEIDWHQKPKWNPHAIVTTPLRERLKETGDLVWIVNYLVDTIKPMQSLGNFGRIRFQSQKVLAHVLGQDVYFPFRLKYHLTASDETTIRLLVGTLNLEFKLLADSKIAVRDASKNRAQCAGMLKFFKSLNVGEVTVMSEGSELPQSGQKMNSLPLPVVHIGLGADESSLMEPEEEENPLPCSTLPVLMSHAAIDKACNFQDLDGRLTCPLDEYLSALTYLMEVRIVMERIQLQSSSSTANQTMAGYGNVIDVQPHYIVFRSTQLNGQGKETTSMVTYRVYLCPDTFACKLKIEYDENTNPEDTVENINTIQQFFEKVVCQSRNEIALQTFLTVTRITSFGATKSIANVMSSHMDTSPMTPCHIQLQMIYLQRDSTPQMGRKFASASMVDGQHINVMILISFRRTKGVSTVKLIYNSQTNVIRANLQEDELTSVTNAANSEASTTGECAIWVAIRMLMDRFTASSSGGNRQHSQVSMNMSVTGPGSVVGPPSLAGPQSVGQYPQSVGQYRQMGGPQSHQSYHMNPSSVGTAPGSVGYPGSVGPGSTHMHMNPPSVGNPPQ